MRSERAVAVAPTLWRSVAVGHSVTIWRPHATGFKILHPATSQLLRCHDLYQIETIAPIMPLPIYCTSTRVRSSCIKVSFEEMKWNAGTHPQSACPVALDLSAEVCGRAKTAVSWSILLKVRSEHITDFSNMFIDFASTDGQMDGRSDMKPDKMSITLSASSMIGNRIWLDILEH